MRTSSLSDSLVDSVDNRAGLLLEKLAGPREANRAARPVEELDSKAILEPADC